MASDPPAEAAAPRLQGTIQALLLHILCVLTLAWPALLNGQPFFFSDTTSYIRAADVAVYMASDHRIATDWTSHYASDLGHANARRGPAPTPAPTGKIAGGNDIAHGNIMAGRSPYFGAALYLGYVSSDFWLFVLGYALVTYLLIGLSLQAFGIGGRRNQVAATLFVAVATTAAFYNSYLLADALTAEGILAFLILAARGDRLNRASSLFLAAIMIFSAVSHLTHIVVLLALVVTAIALAFAGLIDRQAAKRACLAGAVAVVVGIGSIAFTSLIVERVMGKPPVLVPLLTARFIEDGPGERFIREHCAEQPFTVCRFADRLPIRSQRFLWATPPEPGVFMTADDATRRALSREDTRFAFAVWKQYPLQQTGMIAWNAWLQLATFDSFWLNYGCAGQERCPAALPDSERAMAEHTLSGENRWPARTITAWHYLVVCAALIVLAAAGTRAWKHRAELAPTGDRAWLRTATAWILLVAAALLVNALMGGAISEPQSRYQGRVVWLLPFIAYIVAVAWRRTSQGRSPR